MFETVIKYDLSGIKELSERYPAESRAARESKVTEAVQLLERLIKEATPEGAGPIHLRDTIYGQVVSVEGATTGILGTPAVHGEPVESGTKPHFPPVDAIRHWVVHTMQIDGKEADSVAFLVARAISRRGTEGAHMFKNTIGDNMARVLSILSDIADETARRVQ